MDWLMSRWSRPRRYDCAHDCPREAVILSPGCFGVPTAHNCCARHLEPTESEDAVEDGTWSWDSRDYFGDDQ